MNTMIANEVQETNQLDPDWVFRNRNTRDDGDGDDDSASKLPQREIISTEQHIDIDVVPIPMSSPVDDDIIPQSPNPDHLNDIHEQRTGSSLEEPLIIMGSSAVYREQDLGDFPHFFPLSGHNNTNTPMAENEDRDYEEDSKVEVPRKIKLDVDWSLFNRNIGPDSTSQRENRPTTSTDTEQHNDVIQLPSLDEDSLIPLSRNPGLSGHLNFLNEHHDQEEEGSTTPDPIPESLNLDSGLHQQLINHNLNKSKESLQVPERSDESSPKLKTNCKAKESAALAPLKRFLRCHTRAKTSDESSIKARSRNRNDSAFHVETRGSSRRKQLVTSQTPLLNTRKPRASGNSSGKRIKCDFCDQDFTTKSNMERHIGTQHSRPMPSTSRASSKFFTPPQEFTLVKNGKKSQKIFKCNYCDTFFTSSRELINHEKITHDGDRPYKSKGCRETYAHQSSSGAQKKGKHDPKKFDCTNCDKTFADYSSFILHRGKQHTREKRYKCTYWDKTFRYQTNMIAHRKKQHPGKSPHQTGEKPYKCDHCPKTFFSTSGKFIHTRIHTGKKPYKCGYCPNKSFYQMTSRNSHIATHTGEKPYNCDQCSKTFATRTVKVQHMRTHTGEKPYKCDHCPKTFVSSGNKVIHMRTHTGEKPYKCDHCPKTFAARTSKVQHMRSHTGEKPYKCSYCQRTFSQMTSKNSHIRTNHTSNFYPRTEPPLNETTPAHETIDSEDRDTRLSFEMIHQVLEDKIDQNDICLVERNQVAPEGIISDRNEMGATDSEAPLQSLETSNVFHQLGNLVNTTVIEDVIENHEQSAINFTYAVTRSNDFETTARTAGVQRMFFANVLDFCWRNDSYGTQNCFKQYCSFCKKTIPSDKSFISHIKELHISHDTIPFCTKTPEVLTSLKQLESNTFTTRVLDNQMILNRDMLKSVVNDGWLDSEAIYYGLQSYCSWNPDVAVLAPIPNETLSTDPMQNLLDKLGSKLILIPVLHHHHWLLFGVWPEQKVLKSYDPKFQCGRANDSSLELLRILGKGLDDWKYSQVFDIPQQTDPNACGVMVILFGKDLAQYGDVRPYAFGTTSRHMKAFRKELAHHLFTGTCPKSPPEIQKELELHFCGTTLNESRRDSLETNLTNGGFNSTFSSTRSPLSKMPRLDDELNCRKTEKKFQNDILNLLERCCKINQPILARKEFREKFPVNGNERAPPDKKSSLFTLWNIKRETLISFLSDTISYTGDASRTTGALGGQTVIGSSILSGESGEAGVTTRTRAARAPVNTSQPLTSNNSDAGTQSGEAGTTGVTTSATARAARVPAAETSNHGSTNSNGNGSSKKRQRDLQFATREAYFYENGKEGGYRNRNDRAFCAFCNSEMGRTALYAHIDKVHIRE